MSHLIKVVSALFILALFSVSYAHNKVVVIAMGEESADCGIRGSEVTCPMIAILKLDPVVDLDCTVGIDSSYTAFLLTESEGKTIIMQTSNLSNGVYSVELFLHRTGSPYGSTHIIGSQVHWQISSSDQTSSPEICSKLDFKPGSSVSTITINGEQWMVSPQRKFDGSTLRVDAIIFERQP